MSSCNYLSAFEKECKRLSKKYNTLEDDLEMFKSVLLGMPTGQGKNFTIIHAGTTMQIVKARMACRALRDRSLRLIYAYNTTTSQFDFIELYFKGEKENEDRGRIREYIKATA